MIGLSGPPEPCSNPAFYMKQNMKAHSIVLSPDSGLYFDREELFLLLKRLLTPIGVTVYSRVAGDRDELFCILASMKQIVEVEHAHPLTNSEQENLCGIDTESYFLKKLGEKPE